MDAATDGFGDARAVYVDDVARVMAARPWPRCRAPLSETEGAPRRAWRAQPPVAAASCGLVEATTSGAPEEEPAWLEKQTRSGDRPVRLRMGAP